MVEGSCLDRIFYRVSAWGFWGEGWECRVSVRARAGIMRSESECLASFFGVGMVVGGWMPVL